MKKSLASESPLSNNGSANNGSTNQRTASDRKLAANRANARCSTGPRTAEGKARSSLNAIRHGILARAAFNLTLEGEVRRLEFDDLVRGLAQEFQPRTMSDHLTVQQLAGCYWRLAKVLTFETESAWRANAGTTMPIDEYETFIKAQLRNGATEMMKTQLVLFPKAGLGNPTIPSGVAARTVLRYEASVNSVLFRCLAILERRRKERLEAPDSDEGSQVDGEQDYMNEPIERIAPAPPAPAGTPRETPPAAPAPANAKAVGEKAAPIAEIHERTQKTAPDAGVSKSNDDGAAPSATAGTSSTPELKREKP